MNNHQADLGTTLQGGACGASVAAFAPVPSGTPGEVKLKLTDPAFTDRCMTHTPLPTPPPLPPPPPPKRGCAGGAGGCSIVTHAVIEVLRLNADWGPDPSLPRPLFAEVENPTWGEFFENLPRSAAAGLLEIQPSQQHGSRVVTADDPTFVRAYASRKSGILFSGGYFS